MGNEPDLLGVGDHDPADMGADDGSGRSGIAGCLDHDYVVLGQPLCESLQWLAAHDDASQPSELAVLPGHRFGKGAVDIQPDDPHGLSLRSSLVRTGACGQHDTYRSALAA